MKIPTPIRQCLLSAIVSMACFTADAQSERVNLPDMGGSAGTVFGPGEEEAYADDFERYMRAHNLLVEDPLVAGFISDMGFKLVSRSERPESPFRFRVIRSRDINAFASPGGLVGMNAGLILAADTESEVAGVFAHEIAHVTQNHLARGFENQQQVSLPILLASLGLAIAAGLAGAGSDAVMAGSMIGQGLATQSMINYTRQMEYEADRVGIRAMSRAGYDPLGMSDFFAKLTVISRAYGQGPPEYLRTHPLSTTRTAEAKDRARAARTSATTRQDSSEFHLMQARLRVLIEPQPEHAIEYFTTRLDNEPDGPLSEANKYGLALAQIRAGRLDDDRQSRRSTSREAHLRIVGTDRLDNARATLDDLLSADPGNSIYRQLQAEWHIANGQTKQALEVLTELYQAFGGNHAVATQYSDALLYENNPQRAEHAVEVLRRSMREHPVNARHYEQLAKALDRTGDSAAAAEAVAEAYYMLGNLPGAIDQLRRLQRRNDIDYYQRARISARLSEWQIEMVGWEKRRGNTQGN